MSNKRKSPGAAKTRQARKRATSSEQQLAQLKDQRAHEGVRAMAFEDAFEWLLRAEASAMMAVRDLTAYAFREVVEGCKPNAFIGPVNDTMAGLARGALILVYAESNPKLETPLYTAADLTEHAEEALAELVADAVESNRSEVRRVAAEVASIPDTVPAEWSE